MQIPTWRGGGSRHAGVTESLALVVSALASLSPWASITWQNSADPQKRPILLLRLRGIYARQNESATLLYLPEKGEKP